jgi:cytosine/adenosine deaminase-related metal-dependent hydrolase
MPARRVLEMATIDAARAMNRGDDLGSIEPGKRADVVCLDLDHPHLTPYTDIASLLVYQATGTEVTTVICDGEIVVEDGECTALGDQPDPESVREQSRELVATAGLDKLRT